MSLSYLRRMKEFKFEELIREILEYNGFNIILNSSTKQQINDIDIIAEINNYKYIVEVKYYKSTHLTSKLIFEISKRLSQLNKLNCTKVLITSSYLDENYKIEQSKLYDIIIIDISNLLYMVKDNEILRTRLVSFLEYSIQDINELEPSIPLYPKKEGIYKISVSNLINELKEVRSGNNWFSKYEKVTTKILIYLFEEELTLWNKQTTSNDGLYRFDLVCKVKNGGTSEFFNTIKTFFRTKYIIFEFKNFSDLITQKEIYTTEKYLYSKALRGVAIIISRKGIDKNGLKAIKGILRESGKLIVSLSDEDLINMINYKLNNNIPSDYLSEKLDELLLELEK